MTAPITTAGARTGVELSLVIPIYNEETLVDLLASRIVATLARIPGRCEVVFVDDGSDDGTVAAIKRAFHDADAANVTVSIVSLSRNFGHQPAIAAGLRAAAGACVAVMDADLQDPPELLFDLYQAWREGHPLVLAQRSRRNESVWRRLQFAAFHRILTLVADLPLPTNVGVFGLMDRRVVAEVVALPERTRFLPGLRAWVGWQPHIVLYERQARAGGRPKQTTGKLYRMAFDSIFGFSHKPLRLSWMLGLGVSLFSFLYATILLVLRLLGINVVRGFTTTAVAILFIGGVQLIMIGILGEYMGRIYDEVKGRPSYIVKEVWSSDSGEATGVTDPGPPPSD